MEVKQADPFRGNRIVASLVFGAGFTGLFFLLLKATIPTVIALVLSLLLLPGGILLAPFFSSEGIGSALAMLMVNALVYSIAAYMVITLGKLDSVIGRRATIRFVAPAAILFGLACFPALNPLWPHKMDELARQERELQGNFPLGTTLDQGRAVLRSKGIGFREETEVSESVVLQRANQKVLATAGDRVVSARFPTDASVFPCGYDMEIVLVFGSDDKLKQQYVHRMRLCP